MKNILSLLAALLVGAGMAWAQEVPFVLGIHAELESVHLSEVRTLNIYLPEGYREEDSLHYPVVYLLDGSAQEDFIHIVGLAQFMNMYELFPKSIVVGIANVDRKRDFTYPTTIEQDKIDYPTTGGSEKFMAFLEHELQPYIQAHYKVSPSRTLIGQSLGALLATEVLFKNPTLFDQYIIISPSLWWDKQSLFLLKPAVLEAGFRQPTKVFVGVGKEHPVMRKDARRLGRLLQQARSEGLQSEFRYFPDEDHATILHQAVYEAFQWLYPKPQAAK